MREVWKVQNPGYFKNAKTFELLYTLPTLHDCLAS